MLEAVGRERVDGGADHAHVLRTAPFVARLVKQTGSHLIHSNSTTAHLVGGLAAERTLKPAIWHARDLVSLQRIAPALSARATRIIVFVRTAIFVISQVFWSRTASRC